jgi:hypothetical protein
MKVGHPVGFGVGDRVGADDGGGVGVNVGRPILVGGEVVGQGASADSNKEPPACPSAVELS